MSDQHCTELLSCSDRAYPGLSAANRVKKAAAAHLICHPDQCSSSSVAKAVHLVLGTSAKDLGLPSFRQLLSDDPCFIVHGAKESEAYIKLNKGMPSVSTGNQKILLQLAASYLLGHTTAATLAHMLTMHITCFRRPFLHASAGEQVTGRRKC